MALIKVKPTSPGRRAVIQVKTPGLHKGAPHAPLLEKQSKSAGRNNNGRITTRHMGGGHKQHYRVVDFRRNKDGIPADGERRYIIASKGLVAGAVLFNGPEAPIKPGNC